MQGLDIRMNLATGKRSARKLKPRSVQTALVIKDSAYPSMDTSEAPMPVDPASPYLTVLETLPHDARKLATVLLGLPLAIPEVESALTSGATGLDLAKLLRDVWTRRQVRGIV
jgi:hypothetical protein